MISLFTRDSCAKFINEQLFFIKILMVMGITVLLLFVDNKYLTIYVTIAGLVSILFLLYQSITLIDFAYNWNDLWIDKYDNGTTFYGVLLVIGSISLAGATGYLLQLNLKTFWISGCHMNQANLILNLALVLILIVLVLVKFNENSSVLTALFISLIFTYYNGSALSSYDSSECNPFADATSTTLIYSSTYHIIINLILAYITCLYTSVNDNTSENFKQAGIVYKYDGDETNEAEKQLTTVNTAAGIQDSHNNDLSIYKTNEFIIFHLVMIIFSIYLTMIFFDWRKLELNSDSWSNLLSANTTAFSLKMINNILFVALYTWTLIAPAIIQDREFN